jgi:hypothetical protein
MILLLILFLFGCAPEPSPWTLGEKVEPPFGCGEMRTEGREVDC